MPESIRSLDNEGVFHPYEYARDLAILKNTFMGDTEADLWVDVICAMTTQLSLSIFDVGIGDASSIGRRIAALRYRGRDVRVMGVDPGLTVDKIRNIEKDLVGVSVRDLRFEDFVSSSPFDIVNSTHSLYYLDDTATAVRKMLEFTRPDGLLIVTLWSADCVLHTLASGLGLEEKDTVTAGSVHQLLERCPNAENVRAFEFHGRVDFQAWRSNSDVLDAAVRTIMRRSRSRISPDTARSELLRMLDRAPQIGTRVNTILVASKRRR